MNKEADHRLAELLEEFHRRRALGEFPRVEEFEARAGKALPEFREIVGAEQALDEAMGEEEERFPHLFCEYTLLRELGRGAVGVVYEAVHRGLGRTVALKILQSGFDTHQKAIGRFRREARACAQVRHDHIVEVYEAGECQGRHFYAMALMEGKTLSRLAKDGDLPAPRAFAGAMAGVADALHALHEAGIVHRDVKPSNIVLESGGRMVLADFGLARTVASESLTQTGDTLGTPAYMSPEQLLGQQSEIDGRTDVYGLGASLYEVLAGRPVFKADDIAGLMRMILSERPQPLREVRPDLPAGLGRIVMKALEKRAEDRYGSAAEMRDDLRAYAEGERVQGRPVSRGRHLLRTAGRFKWPLAAAAAAVAVAVALHEPAPGRLSVVSVPPARLTVGGSKDRGTTPRALAVAPGSYRVTVSCPGFRPREQTITVASDSSHSREWVLQPEDPGDPEAIALLAKGFDVEIRTAKSGLTRSAYDLALDGGVHLWPAGRLLPADDTFRIVTGLEFDVAGAVVFRVEGREIARHELDEDDMDVEGPWPDAVRTALARGEAVTWGYEPDAEAKDGEAFTRTVRRAPAETRAKLAALRRRVEGLDPLARGQIVAQACLAEKLWASAYREAQAVCRERVTATALDALRAALAGMLPDAEETPFAAEVVRFHNEFHAR